MNKIEEFIREKLGINKPNEQQKNHWKNFQAKWKGHKNLKKIWKKLTNDLEFDNKAILDIGCNNGRWSRLYDQHNNIITGLDYTKRLEYPYDFIHENILKIKPEKLENKKFDIIHTAVTLQHIQTKKQIKALSNINELLDKDGSLVLIENKYSPNPIMYGRDWKQTIEHIGLQPVKVCGDGRHEGILAQKKRLIQNE